MAHAIDDLKMVHEEEMKNYDRIESAVVSVMRRHGCKIIQTPTFEDYDTYGTYFPQLQREMIKTISSEGEVLVMRPDVTVPLVKTASREYPDARQLLKFGYVSMVFREYYGKSTHGKYFLQSGVEVLGDETPECDGEVMVMAAEFLESVGIHDMRHLFSPAAARDDQDHQQRGGGAGHAAGCDGASCEDGVARVSGCAAAFEIRLRVDGLP